MSEEMTCQQVCEFIADVHFERTGVRLDPRKDIWEISPTGELWPVAEMYDEALAWRAAHGPGDVAG